MTLPEMMRLQGIDPDKVKIAGNRTEQGQQIGNAMSVNVLQLLLKELIAHPDESSTDESQGKMMIAPYNGRPLILDSGATFHMVCDDTLTEAEEKAKRSCPTINLNTANGAISSSTVTDIYVRDLGITCLLYTSPSPRDRTRSRMPSSA